MIRKLLMLVLAMVMCSMNMSAQTKKPARKATTQTKSKAKPVPKNSREYQVGKDGFEWYKVCKNGKYGAEDRNGKLLIPNEYNEICYYDWLDIPGYFWVKTNRQGMGEGMYSQRGECIIPMTKNYHSVSIHDWNREQVGAYFQYCVNSGKGNTGICNIKGERVFEANCHYDDIKPYFRNGKFFYEVGICENGWQHGIIDGNGSIIIPLKYKEIGMWGTEYFYDMGNHDAIIGNYKSIVTNNNKLADNIRLTHAVVSSHSSSSSSSSSSASNSNSTGGTQTIVVEHKHDPVPMQVWKQCTGCYGSGMCQSGCGGSGCFTGYSGNSTRCIGCGGSGKCQFCAGQGGHYEVEYR